MSTSERVISVDRLTVGVKTQDGPRTAVQDVSFSLGRGEMLGLVGESGSGKSLTALAVMGLTSFIPGVTVTGSVVFRDADLLTKSARERRSVRGGAVGMVFQDPFTGLHPYHRVGAQIEEAVLMHQDVSRRRARREAIDLLGAVGLPDPARLADVYPHELSGGGRQRVMIAMALSNGPDLLIADEPTTALDVTLQSQIIDLIDRMRHERDMAVILITHDLGIVAQVTDRVAVMYAGRIVEQGAVDAVIGSPAHPYTWGLLNATPWIDMPDDRVVAAIPGNPPSVMRPVSGCPFHPRCVHALPTCSDARPDLGPIASAATDHLAACWLPTDDRGAWEAGRQAFVDRAADRLPKEWIAHD